MSERSRSSATVVKLFCPSLSKLVPFTVASEEEKLDLGAIARTFGLEPGTLKLNGHFISRGVDLVSSSVTWNSLISFFASRGLSTGTSDREALIVDGKLCKPGMKTLTLMQKISARRVKYAETSEKKKRKKASPTSEPIPSFDSLPIDPLSSPPHRSSTYTEFEKGFVPDWSIKTTDSVMGDPVIGREFVMKGVIPNDRIESSLLTTEALELRATQAVAMTHLYTAEVIQRVTSQSQHIDTLKSTLASRDAQINKLEVDLNSANSKCEDLSTQLVALNISHQQELRNAIEGYKTSKAWTEDANKYMEDNCDVPYLVGWAACSQHVKAKYPNILDEDLEEPGERARRLADEVEGEDESEEEGDRAGGVPSSAVGDYDLDSFDHP